MKRNKTSILRRFILISAAVLILAVGAQCQSGMMFNVLNTVVLGSIFSAGLALFMYTDGITETISEEHELYGEKRLKEILKDGGGEKLLVQRVYDSISAFSGNKKQADDITMPAVNLKNKWDMEFPAIEVEIRTLKKWLLALNAGSRTDRLQLCLAAEEIFMNICSYAYGEEEPEDKRKIYVTVCVGQDDIMMEFRDNGIPYNPLEHVVTADEYDIDSQIGGLGKLLAFSLTDSQEYVYENGQNKLTLTRKTGGVTDDNKQD